MRFILRYYQRKIKQHEIDNQTFCALIAVCFSFSEYFDEHVDLTLCGASSLVMDEL